MVRKTNIPEWAEINISEAKNTNSNQLDLDGYNKPMPRLFQIPLKVFEIQSLERLVLSNNWSIRVPEKISDLKNLKELYLDNNKLQFLPDEIGNLEQLNELFLQFNEFKEFPETAIRLRNLQILDLSYNQLELIPDDIERLANLKALNLCGNRLHTITDSIINLSYLQQLNLSQNKISEFPVPITQLQNLVSLNISNNQLTQIPDNIDSLLGLKSLSLSNNYFTNLPDTLFHLTNLELLDLSQNHIEVIPPALANLHNLRVLNLSLNQIKTIPSWLIELPKLERLYVYSNPIETPPPEVFKTEAGTTQVNLDNLRKYFRQLEEEGVAHLFEAKLLIVGEPGAGKTSLATKLINPAAQLPEPKAYTKGIDVWKWEFPYPTKTPVDLEDSARLSAPRQQIFRVNIWDFGGQEIYLATHQFFLTRRSVYALVADAREQKIDFYYWLNLVDHLSDSSPTLIVTNEKLDQPWTINEGQLRGHFTHLKSFHTTNLATNRGLDSIRRSLQYHLTTLPHVGNELPQTWVRVRKALETNKSPTIPLSEYLEICEQYGFTRHEDKLQLSSYLHDLGVCLHFQGDPLLNNLLILKPEWGTEAAYRVLDNGQVKTNLGHFSKKDLSGIWGDEKYAVFQNELLALMMKFQLCYQLPDQPENFIAPQLLSLQSPDYSWPQNNNLYLRYRYEEFMPKGILSRFIVAMHPYIAGNLVWRTGVILIKDGTGAEIIEWPHRREIRIRVEGQNKRDFLTIISHELDEIHSPFHRLKYHKLVPCNCELCGKSTEPYFYPLNSIKRRIADNQFTIECDKSYKMVDIWGLIDDVGTRSHWLGQEEEQTGLFDLPKLLDQLNETFNEGEFRTLCVDFDVKYDNLPGQGLEEKQRELLLYAERHGRLRNLIELVRRIRPNRNW